MAKKQFKAESKKLLDMMIHSIYTHKEIFLRELISNASDAIDKLYFRSLTDNSVGLSREELAIRLTADKEARVLTVSDNGCGMSAKELEENLGTIAKSGSLDFKKNNEQDGEVDIIGQFGVGFYSAFMVCDRVEVLSRAFGEEEAHLWSSTGVDGYTIEPAEKETAGTEIRLYIKPNTEEENYDMYLEDYRLSALVKKYSDYIRYPIKMSVTVSRKEEGSEEEIETVEERVLNSMVPLWKKAPSEVEKEAYHAFYHEKFMDYEDPARVIHSRSEGQATFHSLLFIPRHAPYDYYTKDFEKGLQLYSSGVMIMEKCADLLPDHFSFVKGLVDSADLSLNISREMLQHDHQLKIIAKNLEKKIKNELSKMLKDDREVYEEFFKAFGIQLKFGIYNEFGRHKDTLKDLVLFHSSSEKKPVTLSEYVARMGAEQKAIYYACGETVEKIDMLPQAEAVKDKGYEILYLTDNVDEFALKILGKYDGKSFANICADELDIATEEEKEAVKRENESAEELLGFLKETLGDAVNAVRFTGSLKNHPVSLVSEGGLSLEMEKVLNAMPGDNKVKAEVVLEINANHPIADKLKTTFAADRDKAAKFAKILYAQARLIGGMSIDNPTELSNLVCDLIV